MRRPGWRLATTKAGGWLQQSKEDRGQMDKAALLEAIRAERAALEEMLAGLSPERMLEPGVEGEWSVKDILAHIVAWEGWMIRWTGQLQNGESPLDPTPAETWDDVDRMNAENHERNRERILDDVRADFRRSYADACALVESLPEEALQQEHPDTWPHGHLWQGVAANTCWHYREHVDSIRAYIERGNSGIPPI